MTKVVQEYINIGGIDYAVALMNDIYGNVGISYIGRYDIDSGTLLAMTAEEEDALGSPWQHMDEKQKQVFFSQAYA